MSYDLFFFRPKGSTTTENGIREYLNKHVAVTNEQGDQWWYENEDTGVYCSFEHDAPEDSEQYDGFEATGFSFNLNYMRPAFFGLETFPLVENFMTVLDLYVLNPQSSAKSPVRTAKGSLFINWNETNLRSSADHFEHPDCTYVDAEKSDMVWRYNFNKNKFREQLGENYFVPRLAIMRRKKDLEAVTIATWTDHIPMVIPPADYFVLVDLQKGIFRATSKKRLITRESFDRNFASYLDDFDFEGCRIIHPAKAELAREAYYAVKPDKKYENFLEHIDVGTLYNAR